MAKVYVSTVIDAPAPRVWEFVRDFNGLPGWFPGVTDSRIESGEPTKPGCVRDFGLPDGARIREELLAFSDDEFSCEYRMLSSPLPISNYRARLHLARVTEGDRCFAELRSSFECASDQATEFTGFLAQTYQGALENLKERFTRAARA